MCMYGVHHPEILQTPLLPKVIEIKNLVAHPAIFLTLDHAIRKGGGEKGPSLTQYF